MEMEFHLKKTWYETMPTFITLLMQLIDFFQKYAHIKCITFGFGTTRPWIISTLWTPEYSFEFIFPFWFWYWPRVWLCNTHLDFSRIVMTIVAQSLCELLAVCVCVCVLLPIGLPQLPSNYSQCAALWLVEYNFDCISRNNRVTN